MTERLTQPEQISPGHIEAAEHVRPDTSEKAPHNNPEATHHDISELQAKVEAQAISVEAFPAEHTADSHATTTHSLGLHAHLKNVAYQQTLTQVRSRLSTPQRVLSRIVHTKAAESAAEIAETTVGRAYGILGGSVTALIGSAYLLYAAKTSGYEYNYGWLIVLFAVGYIITTLVEALLHLLKR